MDFVSVVSCFFSVINLNNTSVLFNLSEKNRGMNKEIEIKSIYCFVQVQFGLKNREIGYC